MYHMSLMFVHYGIIFFERHEFDLETVIHVDRTKFNYEKCSACADATFLCFDRNDSTTLIRGITPIKGSTKHLRLQYTDMMCSI